MKRFIILVALLTISAAEAYEIKVRQMKRTPGFTERFDLVTNLNHKVVLDCQSFVQGLLFGPVGDEAIMLQEWECDELMVEMNESLRGNRKHCLEVDMERGVLDSHQGCL